MTVKTRRAWILGLLAVLGALMVGVVVASRSVWEQQAADGSPVGEAPVVGEMVSIPAGTFMMGSVGDLAEAFPQEHPQHGVSVAAFHMDRTEVTVRAYEGRGAAGDCNAGHSGRANDPINCVDWEQATAYCAWVGKRLPTEEEWEYAARGTDGRTYPWGNDEPRAQVCFERDNTCAVGRFPAGDSPFGLHDMAGNVVEWTSSLWSEDYDKERTGPGRVIRGGGYCHDAVEVRAAFRANDPPRDRDSYVGFRCAG